MRPSTAGGDALILARPALALIVAATLAACSSRTDGVDESPALIPSGALESLVLQPDDLPDSFIQFDVGQQALTDAPVGPRADPGRFGRQGGWKARYRQTTQGAEGPLVVESRADLFQTVAGAEQELAAVDAEFDLTVSETGGSAEVIEVEPIGEGTRAMTLLQPAGAGGGTRFYTIAWRLSNVVATITVQGFADSVSPDDAVELARRQHAHLEAVAAAPPSGAP